MTAQILEFRSPHAPSNRSSGAAKVPSYRDADHGHLAFHGAVIIGFCGAIGSGKTTAARFLMDNHGFERIRMADPLKQMMYNFFDTMGVGFSVARQMLDGHLKEEPTPLLQGKSPRQAMQWLGTEWGRSLLGHDLWVTAWAEAVKKAGCEALADQRPLRIVVDDCRFENEAAAITAMGGRLIRIVRPGAGGSDHASERGLDKSSITHEIMNDGDLLVFYRDIALVAAVSLV